VGAGEILQFGQFGIAGIVIGYFMWRETNDRKDRQAETESRLKLATALATLAAAITGRHNV
jgi:uncharacterized membrane-anchored protein YhcB (DUF1043 family)